MTWVEALPVVGVCAGLIGVLFGADILHFRFLYRGLTDSRVPARAYNSGLADTIGYRLAERDTRMSLFPQKVEWVHPIWRPKGYPEKK